MKLWKRNAVVAAIVFFVCVAVYLNWSYSAQGTATASSDAADSSVKTLGEAELVNAETDLTLEHDESAMASGSAAAEDTWATDPDAAETETTGNYFDTARLNREEARDSSVSMLQQTVDDPDAAADAVSAASDSITAMASAVLQETEIESLVTAKGYPDCVAFIGDNSVSVVVSTESGNLEASDVAKITDIVTGETSFTANQVKVMTAES